MLKKLTGIVGDRKHYEESGATTTAISTLDGGLAFVFGVPSQGKGGPAKGQLIEMAVIERVDENDEVAARQYANWRPVAGGIDFDALESSAVGAMAPAKAFDKTGYVKKKASIVADEAAPQTADAVA